MQYLGIEFEVRNLPELDPGFIPFGAWMQAYLRGAAQPAAVAVEREDGRVAVFETKLYGTPERAAADLRYLERLAKFLLWSAGGFRLYLCGAGEAGAEIARMYTPGGSRAFDAAFMTRLYGREFEVVCCPLEQCPAANEPVKSRGGHQNGCRIGLDADGSALQVAALQDGKPVYFEEIEWEPGKQKDLSYHEAAVAKALHAAAQRLPRVDALGVSTAGVVVDNGPAISNLFLKLSEKQRAQAQGLYTRAARSLGEHVAVAVANDGDVAALSGFMSLQAGRVMGLAIGTSEASGYVSGSGKIRGRINELAFAPLDLSESAPVDSWSGDRGVGAAYFTQDAFETLGARTGIALSRRLNGAQQLAEIQKLQEKGNPYTQKIYRTIGCYLAHAMALYAMFYKLEHLVILGSVVSGRGGAVVEAECSRILAEEYPELAARLQLHLPDENTRRLGQAIAAASLPEL